MDVLEWGGFFDSIDENLRELFVPGGFAWDPLHRMLSYLEGMCCRIEIDLPPTVHIVNPASISIASGCLIEPGAYLEGPLMLGSRTIVRSGVHLRGGVITGTDCVIGHCTEVKHSILLKGSKAAHMNYVGDSVLGVGVNLGAGAKLANFRFDHAPISIHCGGQRFDTHLEKFGAIVGDGAHIGCNAVTNPGTLIGPGSVCYPCTHIFGVLPPQTTYKRSPL